MIYLASPFSHPSAEERHRRYRKAVTALAYLTAAGNIVYSPIVHFYEASLERNLPTDAGFWRENNFTFLSMASGLYVLSLDGAHKHSIGCNEEIEVARSSNLPCSLFDLSPRNEMIYLDDL